MPPTSIELAQSVLRAQCGDRDALELVLRSVQPALRRYVAGLVGADDADDILQDVLLIVSRKLYWLEQPTVFRAWAFRIASRAAFRYLKKRKRWQDATVDDAALEDIAAPDIAAPDDTVLELLDSPSLTPASRAVLVLHFREEMPLAHVAAVLEIPIGTVKSRLAFGLKALRRSHASACAKAPADRRSLGGGWSACAENRDGTRT